MAPLGSMLVLVTAAVLLHSVVVQGNSDVCYPDSALTSVTSGDRTHYTTPSTCEKGPAYVIHTVRGEFHWPPIYRGTCKNLKCKDPPCIARKKVWRRRCVLVFKLIHGHWVKIGFRTRYFWDVLECGCKECSDIKNRRQCVRTKPCPNQKNPKSFCFWQHRKCACCTPYPCPSGQTFDTASCSCVCPKGTKKVGNRCIGDCSRVSTDTCQYIYCEDNPIFRCAVKGYKCECPSCSDQHNPQQCSKTRCLEARNRPYCVLDRSKKCRCPECGDIDDRKQCVKSLFCNNYKIPCRYYHGKCSCPGPYGG